MSQFTLDREVPGDLDEIWNYVGIEKNNPTAAIRQIEMLHDKFALLATHPLLGELREDVGADVRTFVAERYLILYRARDFGVEIIQVVDSARDFNAAIRRKPPRP
jgi:plasmid stabilization system protein ParE